MLHGEGIYVRDGDTTDIRFMSYTEKFLDFHENPALSSLLRDRPSQPYFLYISPYINAALNE